MSAATVALLIGGYVVCVLFVISILMAAKRGDEAMERERFEERAQEPAPELRRRAS